MGIPSVCSPRRHNNNSLKIVGDIVTNVEGRGDEDDAALRLDIDNQRAEALGLNVSEVNGMLSVIFSGREVNDFAMGATLRRAKAVVSCRLPKR